MNKSTSTMNLNRSSTSPVIAKWRFSTVVTNDENSSPSRQMTPQSHPSNHKSPPPPPPPNHRLKPIQLDSSPMSNLKSSNNRVLDLNRQLKYNQQNLTNAIKTINQQQQSPYHVNSKLYKPNSSLLMATNQPTVHNNNNHQKPPPQHQHELLNKNMFQSSNNSNKSMQQLNQRSIQNQPPPPPQKNVCKIQSNHLNLTINCNLRNFIE